MVNFPEFKKNIENRIEKGDFKRIMSQHRVFNELI